MPIEVPKTISIDARNTLVRRRDELQTKYGVSIYFPRNRVRGAFQDMIIKGGVAATSSAVTEIEHILIQWREEFDAFKLRQKRRRERKDASNDTTNPFPTITQSLPRSTKNALDRNAFSALDTAPTPTTNTKTRNKTTWAKMAAKPPPTKPKSPTLSKKFSFNTTTTTTSKQSYTSLPDFEGFDWADDSANGWDTW